MQHSQGKLIENAIIEYINDKRNEQAILIDGKWGSGKTFFVKNKIIPAINNSRNEENSNNKKSYVIYISLYGIKNSKEITNKIYAEIISEKIKLKDKQSKVFDIASKFISVPSKIANNFLKSKGINIEYINEMLELLNMEGYVVIFDDLERCEMGVNEVLGYINDLVEHKKVKTIIVANEEQIGKLSLNKNLEQKYQVVLSQKLDLEDLKKHNNSSINFKDNNSPINSNDNKDSKITIEELKEYTQEVFKNDLIYNEIKEKLIGFTIKYEPNIEEILDNIIEIYVEYDNTKNIINRNKKDIINFIENSNNYNIRTIIFAFMSFEKINKIIDEKEFDREYISKIMDDIFLYCFDLSFDIKNGEKLYKWDSNCEVKIIPFSGKNRKGIKGYKFVDLYLEKRLINKENIYIVINNEIEENKRIKKEQEDKNLSLNQLYDKWWYIDNDDELYEKVLQLKEEINEKKYKIQDFTKIYILLSQLQDIEILQKKDVNEIQNIILEQVRNSNENIYMNYIDIDTSTWDENMRKYYFELVTPLKQILKNKEAHKNTIKVNNYIKNAEGWIFDFGDYCESKKDIFLEQGQFFNLIDLENLKKVILSSSNQDIYDFSSQLRRVYSFENLNDFYKADIESLEKFIEILNVEINKIEGKTKKIVIKSLIDAIQKLINKINK